MSSSPRVPRFSLPLFAALLALPFATAESQGRRRAAGPLVAPAPAAGLRGGYDFDAEAWSVGAQAVLPFARRAQFIPSGDVFFADGSTAWQLNTDIALGLGPRRSLYLGGGLGVLSATSGGSTETRVGPNAFIGLRGPGLRRPTRPFIELRWTFVEDYSPLRLAFGFNVPLPRR